MIMLDNTVVNVALPAIKKDLGVTQAELEWTVAAYALTFASLLLTGGKLGDLYGRRLIFAIGLVVFTLSSLACGLSSGATELIAARAVQGAGAALMMPSTLSIISATFAVKERGTAIGIWAGVSAMALAIGPLIEAHRYGWTSTLIMSLFAIGAISLAAFILLELHQRVPMLDLTLFKSGTFTGANIVAILVTLAMFGIFVFFPIYMQTYLGWSPVQAGAALLPWTIMIVIFAPIAGKLSDRVGSRWLMAGGMTTVAACCLLLSRTGLHSTFWNLLPAFLLGGLGMSFVMTPMSAAAMGAAPVAKVGVASGVLNTFRQVGVALGIAVMGAIVTDRAATRGGLRNPAGFVYGLTYGMK